MDVDCQTSTHTKKHDNGLNLFLMCVSISDCVIIYHVCEVGNKLARTM